METFLIKALQLIVSLSILVLIHELGHFLFARLFKVRVEKFYLFFDAGFALFRFKPKNSHTEYGMGWLPLGGYCKISGMIDESMDTEQMAQPPKSYEFRSKPAWQRLLIMTAGVLFNFLLALFIYSMILFHWGETYLPLENMKAGMYYSETFHNVGFADGDILLEADGEKLEKLDEFTFRTVLNASEVVVLREGERVAIPMPDDMMQRMLRDNKGFASPNRFPMVIEQVVPNSIADRAGLAPNDSVVAINHIGTPLFRDVSELLSQHKGEEISIQLFRNGTPLELTAQLDTTGLIGVYNKSPFQIYRTVTKKYNIFESVPAGIHLGVNTLKGYVNDMKYIFTPEGASSIGGFGTIGSIFPSTWNWRVFWERTAFLSIILAFMNILPIPASDGGHVMFLIYEVVARRKPSDKFMEYAQISGMLFLITLLLYANGNDLFRFIFK